MTVILSLCGGDMCVRSGRGHMLQASGDGASQCWAEASASQASVDWGSATMGKSMSVEARWLK